MVLIQKKKGQNVARVSVEILFMRYCAMEKENFKKDLPAIVACKIQARTKIKRKKFVIKMVEKFITHVLVVLPFIVLIYSSTT